MTPQLSLCAQEVKTQDHDQFLCGLFAPEGRANAYYALHVFYLETAQIRHKVSEPHIGLIRLQWWRDLVARCYSGEQDTIDTNLHKEIADVLQQKQIDPALFDQYFDARQFDMADEAHPDLDSLLNYAAQTGGTIAQIKSQGIGLELHEAQIKIGTAATLCTLLRTMAFQARHMRPKIPHSLRNTHQLDLKAFSELKFTPALGLCVKDIVDLIENEIEEARKLKAPTSPILLETVAIEDYLKRLKSVHYDPFNPNLGNGRLLKQMRLMYLAMRKRY